MLITPSAPPHRPDGAESSRIHVGVGFVVRRRRRHPCLLGDHRDHRRGTSRVRLTSADVEARFSGTARRTFEAVGHVARRRRCRRCRRCHRRRRRNVRGIVRATRYAPLAEAVARAERAQGAERQDNHACAAHHSAADDEASRASRASRWRWRWRCMSPAAQATCPGAEHGKKAKTPRKRPLNGRAVKASQRAGLVAGALMTTAPVLAVASAAPPPLVTPRQSHERPPCARMCFGASHAKKRSAPVRRKYFAA